MQRLDQRYYKKEHTKPIFNRLKIMTIHNLFKYHSINEFYKIIKYRVPYTLFECINTSNRDTSNNVILSVKSNTFLHLAAKFWNSVHKRIITPGKGLETSLGLVKSRMRDIILQFQSNDIPDTWTPSNFQLWYFRKTCRSTTWINRTYCSSTHYLYKIVREWIS